MISSDTLFPILIATLAAWLLSGLSTLAWGKKLARGGDWLTGIPLLLWLAFCGIALGGLAEDKFAPKGWLRGWIGPREDAGAITVGLLQDPFGLVLSLLAALLIGLYLVDRGLYVREKSPERYYSALAVSGSGVGLALIAATPWLVLCGLTLSVLGGFICLGSRWETNEGAGLSIRFAWERFWGLIVAVIGFCLLAASRGAISFVGEKGFAPSIGSPRTDQLGAALVAFGIFVQLGSFPFLGAIIEESNALVPLRVLTTQVLPAWCAFAMLVRFEGALRQLGVFPVFGWVGFGSAALALASGLVQQNWRTGLSIAVSAGFSLAVGALAFAGPRAGVALVVVVGLGGLALATAGNELDGASGKKASEPAPWNRVGSGFGAAALSGLLGYASAVGGLQVALKLYENPPALAAALVVLLLLGTLTWSVHWRILRLQGGQPARVLSAALPFLLSILCLGAVWTGSATGGFFPGGEDTFGPSLLELFFPGHVPMPDPGSFATVAALVGAMGLLGLLIGFSTTGRKIDSWAKLRESAPRFAGFLGSGYSVDKGLLKLRDSMVRLARGAEWLFSEGLWSKWMPRAFDAVIRKGGELGARADDRLSLGLATGVRSSVDAPAKVLQAIQSGDVRWYLFFGIGSGIALLLHFARIY